MAPTRLDVQLNLRGEECEFFVRGALGRGWCEFDFSNLPVPDCAWIYRDFPIMVETPLTQGVKFTIIETSDGGHVVV